jgi:YafQ family addiction module toxin component
MRNFQVSEHLKTIIKKLSKKDAPLHEQLLRKMEEIINASEISHYKNLRYHMKDSKRVHVGHFVLVFRHDPSKNEIIFDDFEHHDHVYNR